MGVYKANGNKAIYRQHEVSQEIGPGFVFLKFFKKIFMFVQGKCSKRRLDNGPSSVQGNESL